MRERAAGTTPQRRSAIRHRCYKVNSSFRKGEFDGRTVFWGHIVSISPVFLWVLLHGVCELSRAAAFRLER
jgi:hypothetical protein